MQTILNIQINIKALLAIKQVLTKIHPQNIHPRR